MEVTLPPKKPQLLTKTTMNIIGTITYQDFEGGFWGIIGDDDQKYYPVEGIPENLQTDGLRVEAEIEPTNVFSFIMWGKSVILLMIRRI